MQLEHLNIEFHLPQLHYYHIDAEYWVVQKVI